MREIIVSEMRYDDKGLPVPGSPLAGRPSRPGDHFTVIRLVENRLASSYDIAVAGQRPDFKRPFEAVYEWTGRGFRFGLEGSQVLMQGVGHTQISSEEEAAVTLAIVFAPLTVGTVGGFVVGIVDGVWHTAVELSRIGKNKNEQLITRTSYEYDPKGRLVLMRMLSPDGKQELVRTEFVYEASGTEPARTVVRSLPERRDREITEN